MVEAVEIYICKKGQKVEDGQMVMSHDIDCKEAAQEDAEKRCKVIPSIERVVYYDVSGGSFRVLYSYTNPNVKDVKKSQGPRGGGPAPKRAKKRKKPKGFWDKMKSSMGLD